MKLFAALLVLSSSAFAVQMPEGPFDALAIKNRARRNADSALFEGIVKLSNCSGGLVAFEGQPKTNKAVVMTNGHCIQKPGGYLNPGEVWVNVPKVRSIGIYDKNMRLNRVNTTKILYATMTGSDVAYYELDLTYEQIEARFNTTALTVSDLRPADGIQINITSGYWDRNWACRVEGFVHRLLEGEWTFTDSIRYDADCDTIGGTSGTPLVQAGTRTVVGINNTSNESGARCTLNNPCESDRDGNVVVLRNRSYGQQTYQVYGCLNDSFQIDLNRAGCEMAKP